MRQSRGSLASGLLLVSLIVTNLGKTAWAGEEEVTRTKQSRPVHFLLQSGGYLALGGPSGYGPSLAIEILPGSFADRFGLRAEWRGTHGYSEGSALLGVIFEAGASRPQLVLKLLVEVGVTEDKNPILGGGIEWSLWVLGPLGVSTTTTLDLVIDGSDTRPALNTSLNLHLGR